MPNYCENTMRIIALTDEAKAMLPALIVGFSDDPGEKLHAFTILKPTPPELLEYPSPNRDEEIAAKMTEKYGFPDWYEWRIANWGTKWSSDTTNIKQIDNGLIASFVTAWAPPIGIYNRLMELGFDVFATYAEHGVGYAGIWDNGTDEELELIAPEDDDLEHPFEDEGAVLAATFPGVPEELRPAGLGG